MKALGHVLGVFFYFVFKDFIEKGTGVELHPAFQIALLLVFWLISRSLVKFVVDRYLES